jgi:hypothetical protein
LRNYNSMAAIAAVLDWKLTMTDIPRTMESVSKKTMSSVKQLTALIHPGPAQKPEYEAYMELYKENAPNCIPWFSMCSFGPTVWGTYERHPAAQLEYITRYLADYPSPVGELINFERYERLVRKVPLYKPSPELAADRQEPHLVYLRGQFDNIGQVFDDRTESRRRRKLTKLDEGDYQNRIPQLMDLGFGSSGKRSVGHSSTIYSPAGAHRRSLIEAPSGIQHARPAVEDPESHADGVAFQGFVQKSKSLESQSEPPPLPHQLGDFSDRKVSTFVICSPRDLYAKFALVDRPPEVMFSRPHSDDNATLKIGDWESLEKTDGGTMFSVHAPDTAAAWVETNFDHPLLESMRSYGLCGPMAAMLSPEEPAITVFGSISDNWVFQAAQLLSELSGFSVMIRPAADYPVSKWTEVAPPNPMPPPVAARGEGVNDDLPRPDVRFVPNELDDTEGYTPPSMSSPMTDSDSPDGESDGTEIPGLHYTVGPASRLRGGAGDEDDEVDYTPWLSPVHDSDVILEIRTGADVTYKAAIRSKIQVCGKLK